MKNFILVFLLILVIGCTKDDDIIPGPKRIQVWVYSNHQYPMLGFSKSDSETSSYPITILNVDSSSFGAPGPAYFDYRNKDLMYCRIVAFARKEPQYILGEDTLYVRLKIMFDEVVIMDSLKYMAPKDSSVLIIYEKVFE